MPLAKTSVPAEVDFEPLDNWLPVALTLVAGMFMVVLDSSIVNVAIPTMESVFGTDTQGIQWVVTVYLLALGVSTPISGWLADRLGYRRLYLYAMAGFAAGSLLAAASPSLAFMIVARILQAVMGGMIPPCTTALFFRLVPRRSYGLANGYRGLATMVAPAIGPTLGGYLVQYVDWRAIFLINLPIGIVGIALAAALVPEIPTRRDSRFDLWGFAGIATGLGCLLLALSEGSTWGWTSESIVLLLLASGFALALFVIIELQHPDPLIDLRVLRHTAFTASVVFSILMSIALFSAVFFLPLFLQSVQGLGAFEVGMILMPSALCMAILTPLSGRIYDRFGAPLLVGGGSLVIAAGTFLFSRLTLQTPLGTIAAWNSLRGIGMGLALMPSLTVGMAAIPPQALGRAASLRNVAQRVASSFGLSALTAVETTEVAQRLSMYSAQVTPFAPGYRAGVSLFSGTGSPAFLQTLDSLLYGRAFTSTLDQMFVALAILAVGGLIPAYFLWQRRPAGRATAPAAAGRSAALASPSAR